MSNGAALVAWCTSVQGPNGVYVQRVDPVSGAPAGGARRVPGSTSAGSDGVAEAYCPASARVPLVARQGKGFFVATVDGSRRTVYGWPVGPARPLRLAGGPSKQYVAAAASPGPKASVWVGWLDGSKLVLRRSNGAATVFGAPVSVTVPSDRSVYALDLNAQADRVDLITRVQRADGRISLEHAQSYPGLTLTATSGRQPTFRVLDAGDPVRNATVRVGGRAGLTNAAGQVRITGLKPGRATARASAPKYVDAVVTVTVSR